MADRDVSVVVWRGQYRNDGLERLRWINSALLVQDAVLVGQAGEWVIEITAEAASDEGEQ